MSVTKRSDISGLLRQLADEVDEGTNRLTFKLEARRYPIVTRQSLIDKEEAARNGWVLDNTSPSTLTIDFDGRQDR